MEICWGDLLGLQTIAIVLPNVFRHIMQNSGAYTGGDMADSYQRGSHQEHVDQFADERESVLKTLPDKTRIQAQRLLEDLFPLLRKYSYDKLGQLEFSKDRRIAASDRLREALKNPSNAQWSPDAAMDLSWLERRNGGCSEPPKNSARL
jgi:hypothetical protein